MLELRVVLRELICRVDFDLTETTGENNKVAGDIDLHSSNPESYAPGSFLAYELPRRGIERTIVFKVQYIPGSDDLVTVWIDPDLSTGMTEDNQLNILTTHFRAKATFTQIRLRHGGGGEGWTFSDMAVASSFDDFIVPQFWQQWWFKPAGGLLILGAVAALYAFRVARLHEMERLRLRIARDLHDEVGANLGSISLLAHMMEKNPSAADAVQVGGTAPTPRDTLLSIPGFMRR